MLKSLFLIPFLKMSLIYLGCHLLSCFFIGDIISLDGQIGNLFQIIFVIILILSPTYVLFYNVTLVPNFSWVMTTFKNKKQVLTFFLLVQTIAVVISITPAIFYLLIPDYGIDEKDISEATNDTPQATLPSDEEAVEETGDE